MADLSDKASDCDDMIISCKNSPDRDGSVSSDGGNSLIRTCADCGTTKTPLWRGGPAGPKSLCNACGIRSRKRRRALLGIATKDDKKPKKSTIVVGPATSATNSDSQTSALTTNKTNNVDDLCLKKRLMSLGPEVVLQRPRSKVTNQKRKTTEEEQAAYLLMALSCGSVF